MFVFKYLTFIMNKEQKDPSLPEQNLDNQY